MWLPFFSYVDYCMSNVHHKLFILFSFGSHPKIYIYILIELSIFRFFLVFTQKEQVRNQWIIIYPMNKHHLTWRSALVFFNINFIIFLQKICYFPSWGPVEATRKNSGNKDHNQVSQIITGPSNIRGDLTPKQISISLKLLHVSAQGWQGGSPCLCWST